MAAPCRNLSRQLYQVFHVNSRNASLFGSLRQCRRLNYSTYPSKWQFSHSRIKCRPLSTSCRTFSTPTSTNKSDGEKPKGGIITNIALKTHQATIWFLNRVSPKARVFYERFVDGATSFVQDFRFVYSLNKRLKNGEVKLEDVEWKDLYKKMQMKQDVAKVLPVLVIVNIPFVYYVTLPVVLYFQRIFLSDHFITPEDVSNNHQENQKKRRRLYPFILKKLDKRLKKNPTSDLAESLQQRIGEDQLEKQPFSAAELLSFQPLFSQQTSLKSLSSSHLKYLCKLHSQWVFLAASSSLRKRLSTHSTLMVAMDQAILKAGIHSIDEDDLRKLCYQRGLNPVGSDRQTLTDWLTEWTHISTSLTDAEWSLLLHASILLVTGRPHQGKVQAVKDEVQPTSKKDEHQV
ncbi:LETM1 domain-containing protein 1 isoform X1 [Strongylocentrotus purpuratus]|uniref:Letm1 RBD domain-containing protein n=1 Tax=Strongylocentrotus purpuratus TaxID=7668 RepID=A0A7M7RFP5_STRPU|nr:LETM1 domain-containing protein 1 isoform X1 [Strongylocentrotus purpuratus]